MTNDFIKAIEAEGITPPAGIFADGEMHRFDSDNQVSQTVPTFFMLTNRNQVGSNVGRQIQKILGGKAIMRLIPRKESNSKSSLNSGLRNAQ